MTAPARPLGAAQERRRRHRLARVWSNRPGWVGQLTAVNHSTVAMRFIVTGFAFLLVGGALSMFIRLQLAWFGNEVLDPQRYAQFVTLHGTTMMFLFAVPIMEGFAMYLLPKMLGARDLPFPRLSAFGYWCYLFGGLFLYSSLLFDAAPDGGWFMYVPLTDATFSPGRGADFWLIGVTFAEIAAVTAAVELIVAVLITRAPGMDIRRMPLFAWAILVTAFMIAFGFPPLILASVLLEMQRAFDFVFFDVARGGDPLLWQHLFWLFGHPEVYIIFLPAAGVVSMVIPTFARRPVVGYLWIVLALVSTGFLSFGLWVHHMFAVGIPLLALAFFSAASMAVAIPTGIQVFAWIATLWSGRPWLRLPMLHILGFFVVFVLGGLTGVMLALVPFDWQAHDTHFVVAHLHYVLIGGLMFPLFAGLYYWLPLASGRMPSESLGRTAFWLVFVGFNLTFLPMHLTGLLGMPRRAHTYPQGLGVEWLNLLSTAAGFVLATGMIAILLDAALSFRHGRRSGRDPWHAGTLEWALQHPVPPYNFASVPQVDDRYPLWRDPTVAERSARADGLLGDAAHGRREVLGTGVLTAAPEQVIRVSGSTWWPLLAALAIAALLACFIAKWYLAAVLLLAPLLAALLAWAWTTGDRTAPAQLEAAPGVLLPSQYACRNAPGWWALVATLLIDGSLFASLVFAYFYLWLGTEAWPPAGMAAGAGPAAWTALALLAACWGAVSWSERALHGGRATAAQAGLGVAVLLGGGFLWLHLAAVAGVAGPPSVHAYASVVWTLAGFHAVHVAVAMLLALYAAAGLRKGHVDAARPLELRITAAFWRYVVGQGAIAWAVIHLFPEAL
ncbi:cytochrome c oxidase subunit I [Pseudoxanthomonas suwonensis]|uniref:cytochrome-c oxidase n=1 Tax=Pseudoxanthomonas suwonensis TaxID=314722 RepID=A0A0E3ULF4_9GAMM|nr:cytochrome c oxidase subunit I [Pseudoxanthomonas suwonensis]AKC85431.1 cytochrome B561 [Pseudoxanthomonas suwonensis]